MSLKVKNILLTIFIFILQIAPPVLYIYFKRDVMFDGVEKSIALGVYVVLFVILIAFKGAIEYFLKIPGTLKFGILLFLISWVSVTIGNDLLTVSYYVIGGGIGSLTLVIYRNMINKPATKDELLEAAERIVEGVQANENSI